LQGIFKHLYKLFSSAIGAVLCGLLLAQGASTNMLIHSTFTVVILGIIVQLISIFIDKKSIEL